MEDNLILEGLLSMVTEMKEKLEAQVTPASREETLERFGAIEQVLSRLHSNPAVPLEKLQAIQSQTYRHKECGTGAAAIHRRSEKICNGYLPLSERNAGCVGFLP